jgi:hypothetical protein
MFNYLSSISFLFLGVHSVLNYKDISKDIIKSKEKYYKGKFIFGLDPVKFNYYLILSVGLYFIIISSYWLINNSKIQSNSTPDNIFDVIVTLLQLYLIFSCGYEIYKNIKKRFN